MTGDDMDDVDALRQTVDVELSGDESAIGIVDGHADHVGIAQEAADAIVDELMAEIAARF